MNESNYFMVDEFAVKHNLLRKIMNNDFCNTINNGNNKKVMYDNTQNIYIFFVPFHK